MNKEIEIKIQVDSLTEKRITSWLTTHATAYGTITVIDHYLDNPNASFIFTAPEGHKDALTYLRIRNTKTKNYLCLKEVHRDPQTKDSFYCDEYEVGIEEVTTTLALMKRLGYTDVTTLKKQRTIYRYNMFEIVLDTVEGLGKFIEIELKEAVDTPQRGHTIIRNFLKTIGVTSYIQHQQGYVRMLWNPGISFCETITL